MPPAPIQQVGISPSPNGENDSHQKPLPFSEKKDQNDPSAAHSQKKNEPVSIIVLAAIFLYSTHPKNTTAELVGPASFSPYPTPSKPNWTFDW